MTMKRRCSSILVLGALAMTCLAGAALAAGQAAPSGVREFTMTAKNYEFDPSVITVKKGEKVRLIITATDRDHGIKLDAFDIDQVLKKGDPTTIEFTADKAGTFEFKCSVYCGTGPPENEGQAGGGRVVRSKQRKVRFATCSRCSGPVL
jgi:nitrosocyanin